MAGEDGAADIEVLEQRLLLVAERPPVDEGRDTLGVIQVDEGVPGAVENTEGIVELLVEEPAEGHHTEVTVLGEVVEEDRALRAEEALDRFDEEFVRERC